MQQIEVTYPNNPNQKERCTMCKEMTPVMEYRDGKPFCVTCSENVYYWGLIVFADRRN